MKILRNLAGGEGGTGTPPAGALDFNILPEPIRADPSLTKFKTIPDLAQAYLSAQKLIGAKRVAIPGDNATDTERAEFYTALGRPDAPDKYALPEIPDIDPSLKPDPERFKVAQKLFYDAGLTPKQSRMIMEHYMKSSDATLKASKAQSEGASASAIQSLRAEWGDRYDQNVEVAQSVVKKYGDDSFKQYLEQSGMGNNVQLVKMLYKFGTAILDDKERGNGNTLNLSDQTRAAQEITSLKQNKEFQNVLGDSRAVGHKEAVDRWMELHKVAFPGKQQEGE